MRTREIFRAHGFFYCMRIRSLGKFAHPPLPDSQFGFAFEPLLLTVELVLGGNIVGGYSSYRWRSH